MKGIARGGIARYGTLTPDERNAAMNVEDDLLAVAQNAYRAGWHVHERDVLAAAARDLHVYVWTALADRIAHEARATTARG